MYVCVSEIGFAVEVGQQEKSVGRQQGSSLTSNTLGIRANLLNYDEKMSTLENTDRYYLQPYSLTALPDYDLQSQQYIYWLCDMCHETTSMHDHFETPALSLVSLDI